MHNSEIKTQYGNTESLVVDQHKLKDYDYLHTADYGVRLRFGYSEGIALYGQYRISEMLNLKKHPELKGDLSQFEIGLEFIF